MNKFKVGDLVKVIRVREDDKKYGIHVGDIFMVKEDDSVPYCVPINSECEIKMAMIECDLILVKRNTEGTIGCYFCGESRVTPTQHNDCDLYCEGGLLYVDNSSSCACGAFEDYIKIKYCPMCGRNLHERD